jgi:transposase
MNYSYIAGIDISKYHLDLCLIDTNQTICSQLRCPNNASAIRETLQQLPVEDTSCVLLCAEHTGMYGYHLNQVAHELEMDLWMEHPAQIKASGGLQRGKSDPVDSFRIASYGLRYCDKAKLVSPDSESLQQLAHLQSERALLVADRAKYKGQLRDQKDHMHPRAYQDKSVRLKALITAFDRQIEAIDERIEQLVSEDSTLERQNRLLQSVPGVGPRVALAMIVATKAFTCFESPRAFCCYSGVAPFTWHSGNNTHSRARVSHRADKRIKSLLHLGAMAAIKRPGDLQDYYRRKCEEGKAKMSVLNAVRSKLVHRMFAVIKRNEYYIPVIC